MKKVALIAIFVVVLPSMVWAFDITPLMTFDVGVPILYVNKNPVGQVSSIEGQAPIWGLVLGNIRSGIAGDFIFNIVPELFGLGVNSEILLGIGSQAGTNGAPTFIADIPIRAVMKFDIPPIDGYAQLHGGIILENILTAGLTGFNVLQHVDIGVRVKVLRLAIQGGYLIRISDAPKGSGILNGTDAPFYLGVYIPII